MSERTKLKRTNVGLGKKTATKKQNSSVLDAIGVYSWLLGLTMLYERQSSLKWSVKKKDRKMNAHIDLFSLSLSVSVSLSQTYTRTRARALFVKLMQDYALSTKYHKKHNLAEHLPSTKTKPRGLRQRVHTQWCRAKNCSKKEENTKECWRGTPKDNNQV